jgi:hypothetical protein
LHCISALACTEVSFLAKVKATRTVKHLDSLPKNNAVAELCSGKFNVAYFHDLKWKLPTPPPVTFLIKTYSIFNSLCIHCTWVYIFWWKWPMFLHP